MSSSSDDDSARKELVECEREIQKIKVALRQVSDEGPNSLAIEWVGLEGSTDEGAEVALQLSSPVEEAVLTKVKGADGVDEGSLISFSGVESSMATLTVTLKKDGQVVGTSEAYDLAPVCNCSLAGDGLNPQEEYVTELPVAIVAPEGTAATEEAFEDAKEAEEEEKTDDKKEGEAPKVIKPLCTVNLRLVFKPSGKDQKEELYELLNKASVRRSQALEKHKGQQEQQVAAKSSSSMPSKKPAVKAGFLNKTKRKEPEVPKWKQFYDTYLGPRSIARGLVFPIAKNYVIFFGAVVLAHFKGQEMALPAPV